MTIDGYSQQYSSGEISEVSTDLIVEVGSALIPFGVLIAILWVVRLFSRRTEK